MKKWIALICVGSMLVVNNGSVRANEELSEVCYIMNEKGEVEYICEPSTKGMEELCGLYCWG